MSLSERVQSDLTAAMKEQNAPLVAVLRLVKSSLKNEEIKLGHALSDDEVLKVLQHEAKQRKDSITAYNEGGRKDLADAEQAELDLISDYLPKQIGEAELTRIVDEVIAETGANSLAQMGAVIGKVMQITAGAADGGTVSAVVRQKLSA